MDFSHFRNIPIIDSHVHFVHPERMDELLALMDEAHHARANLVCIPNPDATTHNPAALYFKEHHPERVFLSGALEYATALADRAHASQILAGQVTALKARGFDGLKLIEGKPQVRKLLPLPLDGPEYAGLWAALESEQFPVVFHVADPDEFWDAERCPDWARQRRLGLLRRQLPLQGRSLHRGGPHPGAASQLEDHLRPFLLPFQRSGARRALPRRPPRRVFRPGAAHRHVSRFQPRPAGTPGISSCAMQTASSTAPIWIRACWHAAPKGRPSCAAFPG